MDVATSVTPRSNSAPEQIAEQHGIGDVGNEEFVETNDAGLARGLFRDQLQRIGVVLMFLQLVVNPLHEAMEVAALAVLERQRLIKQIHQPGLAASDAAPDVQPLLRFALLAREQALQQALGLGREQSLPKIIQQGNHALLHGIALIAQSGAFALVELGDGDGGRRVVGHGR